MYIHSLLLPDFAPLYYYFQRRSWLTCRCDSDVQVFFRVNTLRAAPLIVSQDELKKQLLTDKVYTRLNKTASRITVLLKQFNSRIRPLKQFNSRIRPSNIPAHALLLEILYAMPLSGSQCIRILTLTLTLKCVVLLSQKYFEFKKNI